MIGGVVTLGHRTEGAERLTVVQRLTECHARIRASIALAVRIAEQAGSPTEVREAARALYRYFTVALPLHIADEEDSVRPRLAGLAGLPSRTALAVMTHEHGEVETLLASLVPAWQALADTPDPGRAAATLPWARELAAHLDEHLAAEEREVFPLIDALPATEQAAIVGEMYARR